MIRPRAFAAAFTLLFVGMLCLFQAQAQMGPLTGVNGPFTRTSRGAAYAGPGDVVSGALVWAGLSCYTTAYAGNVARVRSPSDVLTTTITCSSGGVLGATGTALATTCAVSCTVDILYDQSGAGSCVGGSHECDFVQTTEASRPALTLSCIGSLACMTFNGSQFLQVTNSGVTNSQSQPYTISFVAKRTGNTSAVSDVFSADSAFQSGFCNAANQGLMFAGSFLCATANDNSWHAMQQIYNSASSVLYIDGSSNSGDAGTNTIASSASIYIGGVTSGPANTLAGTIGEVGLWGSGFSGGNQSAMNTNQHSRWGF